jgi:hypothetical protein
MRSSFFCIFAPSRQPGAFQNDNLAKMIHNYMCLSKPPPIITLHRRARISLFLLSTLGSAATENKQNMRISGRGCHPPTTPPGVKRPCGESADGKLKNAKGDLWVDDEYIENQIASRCEQKTHSNIFLLRESDLPATRVIEAKWRQRAALITLTEVCFNCNFQSNLSCETYSYVTSLWLFDTQLNLIFLNRTK